MKIAIIIAGMNIPGGIERVISIQTNYWVRKAGYEVCLLTHLDKACSSFYPLDEKVRNIYIGGLPSKTVLDKIPGVYPLRVIRSRILQYKRVFAQERPDVILTMMHGSENFYMNRCSIGIPIVGVNHITLDLRRGVFERNIIKKQLMKLSFKFQLREFRKYNCVVALSKTDSENLKRLGCKSAFIPNPRTFDILEDLNDKENREKTIIMVGRFDYHKGQDRIIEIWKDLAPKNPDWKLVLVGNGAYKTFISEMIDRYNLSRKVEIVSDVKDVSNLYQRASVFALTSRTESFGMVILEAMANGLPCIVYDCENGPRDIIEDGVNGYLVADGCKDEFIAKLQKLIDNEELRRRFVDESIKKCDSFSLVCIMNQWNQLLDNLLCKYE